jgi:hypothetical protein
MEESGSALPDLPGTKCRRPGSLTLLRGGWTPADRPRLTPGAAEAAQLARELHAECAGIRASLHALARSLRQGREEPGAASGLAGGEPGRAG